MKYIIDLEPIPGTELFKAKGANTLVFDKNGIERILTPLLIEEPAPAIDWSKVPVDTPIIVWENPQARYKRYFSRYEDGVVYAFCDGCTSFSAIGSPCPWRHAELAPGVKI